MDYLWSPWRYQYIANVRRGTERCVFCIESSTEKDEQQFVLFRGKYNFVILNIFPYTCGHLMVSPYQHIADFSDCSEELTTDMMKLCKRCKFAIEQSYHPDGFNLGINLGKSAGAGVEQHIHLHIVPRWIGDANFMNVVGETRVLPETLEVTYQKLKRYFTD